MPQERLSAAPGIVFIYITSASSSSMASPATSPLTPLNDLGGVGLGAWAHWRWWSSPCWIWDSWRRFLTRKTAHLTTKRGRARPPRYVWSWGWGVEGAVCMRCRDAHHLLQLGNRAKRHQPWLSLHSCKGIRNPDGAVWYSEEDKDGASLRGRYSASLLSAPGFTFTATPAGKKTALDVCLCPFSSWFSPLTHCCQTSAVRWRRGRTAGCSGGTRAVTARRAAARTALVMWAMTAGAPAPIVTWMVSSALHIQKSQYNIYLFLNFYLNIYRTTVITLFPRKIFKNRYKL